MKTYSHTQLAKVLTHLTYNQLQATLNERGIKPFQVMKTNAATLRMYDEAAYLSACSIRDEYVKQRDARRALKAQAQAQVNGKALLETNEDLPIEAPAPQPLQAHDSCADSIAAIEAKVDKLLADIQKLTVALGGV